MKIVITGGAGFIGSSLCKYLVAKGYIVHNIDKLTYSGNLSTLASIEAAPNYFFHQLDIVTDSQKILKLLKTNEIDAIVHLAAESHVDRSIDGPKAFIDTNIIGTFNLLEVARHYYADLDGARKENFRFHHVSTDEVYGDLPFDNSLFSEESRYKPSSPYSASKAASDHLVSAWHHTYGLPVVLSNCSNNYGPFHYPEKFIPLMIISALSEKPMTVYGNGNNVRDWLYVEDHVTALELVLTKGRLGESYNIGGRNEQTNISVVKTICQILDQEQPRKNGESYEKLITFVADRLGHDRRYAINANKIVSELGWSAKETFNTGIYKTIKWYLDNPSWWMALMEPEQSKRCMA